MMLLLVKRIVGSEHSCNGGTQSANSDNSIHIRHCSSVYFLFTPFKITEFLSDSENGKINGNKTNNDRKDI